MRSLIATVKASDRPARTLFSQVLWRSRLCEAVPLTVEHGDGFRLRFHATVMGANLWANPDRFPNDIPVLKRYLKPGDVVVDVGANIGVLTLAAATYVGETGRVYAIEAHPRVFRYLADNVALNEFPHVVLENCAVGAEAGSVAFADSVSDDLNYVVNGDDGGTQMRVPRRTLDEIVPHDLPIALLKIDVEGYERFVLAGATSTLQRTAVVFIEVYDALTRRFGYEAKELGQILRRAGFNLFRHDPDAPSLTREAGGEMGRDLANYIGVRET